MLMAVGFAKASNTRFNTNLKEFTSIFIQKKYEKGKVKYCFSSEDKNMAPITA